MNKRQQNAAFIKKLATINIGTKAHDCGLKCPICGKPGHTKMVGALVRVEEVKPSQHEEAFSA